MKYRVGLVVLTASILLWPLITHGQDRPSAAETVDNLKLELLDIEAKRESAKLRAEQLDEALKPENIERSLAGVGSTRPEELREQRRRELSIEKASVTAELQQLALKRSQLESALVSAQAEAYHQSASGGPIVGNQVSVDRFGIPVRRLLFVGLIALGALGVCIAGFLMLRVSSRRNTL
jgi:hypothetical protein